MGIAITDANPQVINVTSLVFANILQQLVAGVTRERIADEDYPMEDASGVIT